MSEALRRSRHEEGRWALTSSACAVREKQAFAQFGSDLDAVNRSQLAEGTAYRLLKQGQYVPYAGRAASSFNFAANAGFLDRLQVSQFMLMSLSFTPI